MIPLISTYSAVFPLASSEIGIVSHDLFFTRIGPPCSLCAPMGVRHSMTAPCRLHFVILVLSTICNQSRLPPFARAFECARLTTTVDHVLKNGSVFRILRIRSQSRTDAVADSIRAIIICFFLSSDPSDRSGHVKYYRCSTETPLTFSLLRCIVILAVIGAVGRGFRFGGLSGTAPGA